MTLNIYISVCSAREWKLLDRFPCIIYINCRSVHDGQRSTSQDEAPNLSFEILPFKVPLLLKIQYV